ncbi:hypothetical protein MFRU_045g00520 [Monilinia fructicola]|uniref:F-box domain-containing protein n=1 Tax=Monilinia fructicola TaxID=38448 RepID=A0A5M9JAI7_MONFR|nr:hypothetical protein EYC84_011067 [Monilinia fructicola]KAG4026107.1 hypothetical protein MFRU_045g00520 [Monilinia fructicola]
MATKSIPAGSRHDDDDNPKTKSPSIPCTTSTRSPSISSTEDSGMVPTSISVIHDTDLFGNRGQMKYLRTYEEEILSLALLYISGTPLLVSPLLCASIEESANTMDKIMLPSDEIKKKHEPFISTPPEIMIGIFKFLNPIDAVCFSLMNKFTHNIYLSEGTRPVLHFQPPLQIGRPETEFPVIPGPKNSCHHCCPVAFFPAHCELHFHLKSFMPSDLLFCAGACQKFTSCDPQQPRMCGKCGRDYRRQFERGRRMIETDRAEGRVFKWYEQPRINRENSEREERRLQRRLRLEQG